MAIWYSLYLDKATYKQKGMLVDINGELPISTVYSRIIEALDLAPGKRKP